MALKILKHDILDIYQNGYTICIPSNGFVKKDGRNVMGAGVAKLIRDYVKDFDLVFGRRLIEEDKNIPFYFSDYRIITFPTKHNWWENSDLNLIRKSCKHLIEFDFSKFKDELLFLPFPGVGNGKLKKDDVLPLIEEELHSYQDKIILVNKE